jgi:hypothetical protein
MLKLTTKHTIYEVWCEWTSESVFIDHKPTTNELEYIRITNWSGVDAFGNVFKLKVFKLPHFYTNTDKSKCGAVEFGKNPKTGKVRVIEGGKVIGEQG